METQSQDESKSSSGAVLTYTPSQHELSLQKIAEELSNPKTLLEKSRVRGRGLTIKLIPNPHALTGHGFQTEIKFISPKMPPVSVGLLEHLNPPFRANI